MLNSQSVDDSSITSLIREDWRNFIVSALEAIKDSNIEVTEDDAMEAIKDSNIEVTEDDTTEDNAMEEDRIRSDGTRSHVTGDGAMNNATVTVDEVLDKVLDNAIGMYGFSAQDVYAAISLSVITRKGIDNVLSGLTYHTLRDAVAKVGRDSAPDAVSHTIFSMEPTNPIGNAHDPIPGVSFTVDFKSRWIRTLVLGELDFLQDLGTAYMIKEMAAMSSTVSFAGLIYEPFAAKKLASGALQDLDLTKMVAHKGTTTFRVPVKSHTIKSPFD